MKTTKILATVVATAIIATGISSTYAMENIQGNGQGGEMGKNLTTEQRTEIQNMSESERQAYMQTLKNSFSGTVNTSGQVTGALKSKIDRNQELKTKLGKNAGVVDTFISKAEKTYSNLSLDEQKIKYENLIKKVDNAVIKVEKLKITDEKKQSYKDLLEYLKIQTQYKIDTLDTVDLESIIN